ncbi:hypothetical protein QJQ45_016175 [Haematococcus lacustris]|nr:hypothetical protein QJQ45_016175 [Haematococcus lacustris]
MARKKRRTGVGGPRAVPEDPDFDRDEAAQPDLTEAERKRKASGEARAARSRDNTFLGRKAKLAHLTGHLPQALWDAFLERAVRPRVKAISERGVIGSLLLGFLVRGLFTLHVADQLDAQGQPLSYTDTDIPVSAADIPNLAAVAAVLAAHPDLCARLEAIPRHLSDTNMVDHVGKQLETAFSNMLTLLFAGRLKKSVSLAGAKILLGTNEHQRRFGVRGLVGGHLPAWSKRQCTYVRRMVCGLEVTWLVGEGGVVVTAAMQAEVALQRSLLGLEEGEKVDDDWVEDPANRGRLLRHAVHTTREMEAAMAAWQLDMVPWQQSDPTNLVTRPPRPPTPYALTPTSKCQTRHIFIDTRGLYGLMSDAGMLGVLTEAGVTSLDKFRNGALPDPANPGEYIEGPANSKVASRWDALLPNPCRQKLANPKHRFAQTVDTNGVAISVMFMRPKPAAPPAKLPRMAKGMGAVNPLAHLHAEWLGVDPGKTNMATVAHEERSADGLVVSVRHWTLTAGQYFRDSGITRQAQATKIWLAQVKTQLTALSHVGSKPSSLGSYRRFADTVLETYDAMWAEVSKPRWANARFRLYCGKKRVVASFWAKMQKEAVKQFRPERVVLVDEFRTSRFSSADNTPSETLLDTPPESFRFYERDVSAALNIRRCAVGPGPRPTELCYWPNRPAMPKPGQPGQEWVIIPDKPLAVPEDPDFDRDEAAQPDLTEAERKRKASGEARAARSRDNTFHGRKAKLAHLTGHLPQALWDAFLERAVRPRVKAISERGVIGSLLLGFLVRGLFTLHVADQLDAQGQPLSYTDTDIPVSAADIPNLAAVAAVLAAHPDLCARLEAIPRHLSDTNMVDHVGKQLETAFSNMLTLLFAGRLKKSVSLAGAKILLGTNEHQRRFGVRGLVGGHLPAWSKRQCTYVRRMVCGLEVTWLVGEGGVVVTAAMQAEVALQRSLLGLEEGEKVDDDWVEDPANRGRLLRHAVHTTREMEAAMAAWQLDMVPWQQSDPTNLVTRPPRPPTPYALTPTSKCQTRHIFIDTRGLYGLMSDAGMLGVLTEAGVTSLDKFRNGALPDPANPGEYIEGPANSKVASRWDALLPNPCRQKLANPKHRFAQTVDTNGVAISVMFMRPKPAAPPAKLPRMAKGMGAVNPLAHLHAEWLGVDPGKTNMATVAHEERSADGLVVSVRHWTLTAGQYFRDSGITRQAQATKIWLAQVKTQLTALSHVGSKPSSLGSYRRFADTVLETYDAMWAEVSKPRWANARFRLYCGKKRVVASFWAKVRPNNPNPRARQCERDSGDKAGEGGRAYKPEQEELKKQIKDYLAKGMIEPSSSPYAAPILFVQKKSDELRMCIDYRQLNKLTLRDQYPLPRIDDLFDRLSGCSVFSSLDLQVGYHQIRITPEDVPKTAFRTPEGHFQFKVLSFGLTNAPATFQRVMNDAFAPVLGKCALVYLDDILVMSKSLPDHMQHLRLVFDLLRANKLFAKMSKCEFMQLTLKFLGHVITAGAISVDPDKASNLKPGGLLNPLSIPDYRWESVSMDFITKLPSGSHGYDAICVFVDRLSKMVHFVPCREDLKARRFAQLFIDNVYKLHGMPAELISDRGSLFTSVFWREVMRRCGSKPALSSSYHPQSDGQTERYNRVLEEMLRHYISPTQSDWPDYLALAEFAVNNSWQESIQSTPFLVNTGQSPVTVGLRDLPYGGRCPSAHAFTRWWQDAVANARKCMAAAQSRQAAYANKARRDVEYKVGQKVLLSTKNLKLKPGKARKLIPRYVGPFEILLLVGAVVVKLDLPASMSRLHPVFHVSLIKPYTGTDVGFMPPPVTWMDETPVYYVERLLDHKGVKDTKAGFYLVQWEGYDSTHNTWEPRSNLTGCDKVNKQAKKLWPDRILALAYGAAGFKGSGTIGCRGVPVSQMQKEAVKQFRPERVVLVDEFRTSRFSSADNTPSETLLDTPPESFRFYERDVSAALNIRRCAVGPGPRPTELCYWPNRPAMPKPGQPGQEWVIIPDKPLAVPEDPDFDRDEAAQPDLTEAERKRKASGEARAARSRDNTFHGRKAKLAHLTGHLPQALWDAFLERAVRPRVKAISERGVIGSLLLGFLVRGLFTLHVADQLDAQGQPLSYTDTDIPVSAADIPNFAAVVAVLAAHPDLCAILEAIPRHLSDTNMVDHVGKQLETAFSNMLTLLFAGRLKKSVSLAGAKVLLGTNKHQRRFGVRGLVGGHLPAWSKRQCTYVRRMVCGLEVTWLVGEGGVVVTAAMQAEVALQRSLLGLEEGEKVDDDWVEDPANRGRLLRHAVHTTREMSGHPALAWPLLAAWLHGATQQAGQDGQEPPGSQDHTAAPALHSDADQHSSPACLQLATCRLVDLA